MKNAILFLKELMYIIAAFSAVLTYGHLYKLTISTTNHPSAINIIECCMKLKFLLPFSGLFAGIFPYLPLSRCNSPVEKTQSPHVIHQIHHSNIRSSSYQTY